MDANFAGAVEMCAYLRVAVVGWCRLVRDAFPSAGCRVRDGVERCGNRQMRTHLTHAAQIRAHLRVPAAVPVRLLGFACLSRGCWPWGTAGTGGCARISSALLRYVPICGFLRLRPFGFLDLRAYLRVAVRGDCAAAAGTGGCARISSALLRYVPICGFLRLRPSGFLDLRAHLPNPANPRTGLTPGAQVRGFA